MENGKTVIGNPVAYNEEKYGGTYRLTERFFPWKGRAAFCTTGQFENLEGGLVRHCGPTAVTNLVLTLQNAGKLDGGRQKAGDKNHNYIQDTLAREKQEDAVFQRIVSLGKRRKLYWNTNVLGRFGGTFDLLAGNYIRSSIKEFSPGTSLKIGLNLLPSAGKAMSALKKGSILYLMLRGNPTYGNHHVICYGYAIVEGDASDQSVFLLVADGWANRTRYIPADQLGHSAWFEVRVRS